MPPGYISPYALPVIAIAVGLEIGNIPAVRDYVDNVFSNYVLNQGNPSGVDNPDPQRNPEYRELVRNHDEECREMILEMERAMGCALSRKDFEDRFRECMRDKGHGWY